jgi:hypothetical protein
VDAQAHGMYGLDNLSQALRKTLDPRVSATGVSGASLRSTLQIMARPIGVLQKLRQPKIVERGARSDSDPGIKSKQRGAFSGLQGRHRRNGFDSRREEAECW